MSKIKIHELAKKLNKTSKEIKEIAKNIGIEIKSHLSFIEEKDVEKIKGEVSKLKNKESKQEKQKTEKANSTPVIIRREVIISDEELAKRDAEKKEKMGASRKKRCRVC